MKKIIITLFIISFFINPAFTKNSDFPEIRNNYLGLGFGGSSYIFNNKILDAVESNKYTTQGKFRNVYNIELQYIYRSNSNLINFSSSFSKSFYILNHLDESLFGKIELFSYEINSYLSLNLYQTENWKELNKIRNSFAIGLYTGGEYKNTNYYGSIYESNTHHPLSFYLGIQMEDLEENYNKSVPSNKKQTFFKLYSGIIFNSRSKQTTKITGYKVGLTSSNTNLEFGYENSSGYLIKFIMIKALIF